MRSDTTYGGRPTAVVAVDVVAVVVLVEVVGSVAVGDDEHAANISTATGS
jgi:hypothetical protein